MVAGLLAFCAKLGVQPEFLCDASDIKIAELENPDARVALSAYIDLMRIAIDATNRPALALEYGEATAMSELSIVGLLMEASETIGDAYIQMRRYGRLAIESAGPTAEPRFELVRQEGRLFLVDEQQLSQKYPELTEGAFSWLACGPRRYMERSPVIAAHVTWSKPDHWRDYERILACPVYFESKWNALEMEPDSLSWPVRQNPKYVFGILIDRAEDLLGELEIPGQISRELKNLLTAVLHEGGVTADIAAQRMGMSRQTLFRRLNDEGTDFTTILAMLRQDLAKKYLKGSKASLNEVAYLVGFSDAASFTRAFKRWTAITPGEFRQEVLKKADHPTSIDV